MAPPKAGTERSRNDAVALLVAYLDDSRVALGQRSDLAAAASEVKGLFNRSARQDQWDWFLVFVRLGRPSRARARQVASALGELSKALRTYEDEQVEAARAAFITHGGRPALDTYVTGSTPPLGGEGFIYVLSTRDQPDVLKVGYTTRPIEKRVEEINGATGVVVPFGARAVWRVRDARNTEAEIHRALAPWRIRSDREFFQMTIRDASDAITAVIRAQRLDPDR